MQARQLHERDGQRTFALIFENGDEAIGGLEAFAREHALAGSRFSAIGAFSSGVVAYFDWQRKRYDPTPIDEQVEVLALNGDIALKDQTPSVHAHVVLGRRDATALGGHLLEGHVRPTLEVLLIEEPTYLRRELDPESGLALIRNNPR